jgi:putative peptidoglycan lipid II flippase
MTREVFVAQSFGAGPNTDAFLVASTIPLSILPSITLAIGGTFIPLFIERHDRDPAEGWQFVSRVLNLFAVWSLGLVAVGLIFAERLVGLMSPGLEPRTMVMAVTLTRILLISLVPQATSIALVGSLQALGKFVWPALLGIPQNVLIILAIVVWGPTQGITAIAYGTVAGYLLGTVLLWMILAHSGFKHVWWLSPIDYGVGQLLRLAVPLVVATFIGQVSLLTERGFASYLPQGSVSALNWAMLLYTLPVSIVGFSLLTVMYPRLVRTLGEGVGPFESYFLSGLRGLTYIMIPMAVGAIWFRTEIVQVVFQRGAFGQEATLATARALLFYAPSVVFHVLDQWIRKAFFSMHDSVSPTVYGTLAMILNIGMNFLLIGSFQHAGIALAYSIGLAAANAFMLLKLRSRLSGIDLASFLFAAGKAAMVAVGTIVPVRWLFERSYDVVLRAGTVVEGVRVALFLSLFVCCYAPLAFIVGGTELRTIVRGTIPSVNRR